MRDGPVPKIREKVFDGQYFYSFIGYPTTTFQTNDDAAAPAAFLGDGDQPSAIARRNGCFRLDFNGDFVPDNKINLQSGGKGAPERQRIVKEMVVEICAQFIKNQVFQGAAESRGSRLDICLAFEDIGDSDVEKIKLRDGGWFSASGFLISRKLVSDEGVFEDLIALPHRSGGRLRIGGDSGEIHLFSAGKACHLQKTGEVLCRSRKPLRADFFLKISPYITPDISLIIARQNKRRKPSAIGAVFERYFRNFRRDERMKAANPSPSAQQIGMPAFELPRARSSQNYPQSLVAVEQNLDFIQERRQFLYFVNDQNFLPRQKGLPQLFRMRAQLPKSVGFKQIHIAGGGKREPKERALSSLARS